MAVTQQQLEVLLAGLSDANGNPYAGYKVFTYEAGSSTKKLTYTDAEAAVQATNPIVLDTAGRANVYGLGIYKLVLAPPTDSDPPVAAIATWDNYELAKGVGTGAETWTGVKTFDDGIVTDTISEETAGAGILADGVKLKDNDAYVDALEEKTSGQGVLLDTSAGASGAVKVKDGVLYADTITEKTTDNGIDIEGVSLIDSAVVVDTISEQTTDNGVIIDSLSIKDGGFGDYAVGDNLILAMDTEQGPTNGGAWLSPGLGAYIPRGGELTIKFDLKKTGAGSGKAKIYVNGVATGTERDATGTYVTWSENIDSLNPNDHIELYYYGQVTPAGDTYIKNFRFYASNSGDNTGWGFGVEGSDY